MGLSDMLEQLDLPYNSQEAFELTDKIFEFIDNEGSCSKSEKTFFNRYKRSWKEKRSEFMEFTIIDHAA